MCADSLYTDIQLVVHSCFYCFTWHVYVLLQRHFLTLHSWVLSLLLTNDDSDDNLTSFLHYRI